jgi:hypothetical protein
MFEDNVEEETKMQNEERIRILNEKIIELQKSNSKIQNSITEVKIKNQYLNVIPKITTGTIIF